MLVNEQINTIFLTIFNLEISKKKKHLKIKAARVCHSLPIGVKVNKFYFSETA